VISIQRLILDAKARGASDLLVMVGDLPAVRVAGRWERLPHPRAGKADLDALVAEMLRPEAVAELREKRELDFSCTFPGAGRVRCNVHYQRDHLAMVLRLVWPTIPDARQLGIPGHVIATGDLPTGLVLVSGPTGAGKSTTLAAIVEHINRTRPAHVITVEDPIEFMYTNGTAIIEQREIGADTPNWQSALRTVLRQAPDVIVLGELRDLESIAIALTAAETGHLVLASVHSATAAGAVSRIVDVFPAGQVPQVRLQLSQALRLVFAQRLVPAREAGARALVYEIMVNTPAIANLIRTGELEQIQNLVGAGRDHGMISFAQCHAELVARGVLDAGAAAPPGPAGGGGKAAVRAGR
jgi:twitching motility protein PilT